MESGPRMGFVVACFVFPSFKKKGGGEENGKKKKLRLSCFLEMHFSETAISRVVPCYLLLFTFGFVS